MGIALLNSGEASAANKVLSRANVLDPYNGNIWAYLTLAILNDPWGIKYNSAF
jgi:hypothetical protein